MIAIKNNGELKRNQKSEKDIEHKKEEWKKQIVGTFENQCAKYDKFIKGELGITKQATQGSFDKPG